MEMTQHAVIDALVSSGTAGIDLLAEALGTEHRSVIEAAVRAITGGRYIN